MRPLWAHWDDAIVTSMTPTPAARCPFEPFHEYPDENENSRSKATPGEIAAARAQYGTDELEVDTDARVLIAEGGRWVAAWVWLEDADD